MRSFSRRRFKSLLDLLPPRSISILDDWDDYKGLVAQDIALWAEIQSQVAQPGVPRYALYRKLQDG